MSRLLHLIVRLPVGLTSLVLAVAMILTWVLYPRPAEDADQVPRDVQADVQLALDRLQVRLTGEQVEQAARARRAGHPARQLLVRRIKSVTADLKTPPKAVRLWVPARLFSQGRRIGVVEKLILLHEEVSDGVLALTPGHEQPVRSESLGPAWYASETHVAALPDTAGDHWEILGTTPLFDERGRTMALVEMRLSVPRVVPLPMWPRSVAPIALAAVLLAFWEVRLALLRVLINDLLGLRLSTTALGRRREPEPSDVQARLQIDRLASRAEAIDRLWLVRPGQQEAGHPKPPPKNLGMDLPCVWTGQVKPSPAKDQASGDRKEPLVSATIENETLLRRLLDILLPHVRADGTVLQEQKRSLDDLSLRVVIEICRRKSTSRESDSGGTQEQQSREESDKTGSGNKEAP